MTKAFLNFMTELKIDKRSFEEFKNLKDEIQAFPGVKIFDIIFEGTKYQEDQGIFERGKIAFKKPKVS